jgi:hypothetical protein
MQVKVFSLGSLGGGTKPCCCGGSTPCTTTFCYLNCTGTAVSGATFSVSGAGSGTTDASGCVAVTIPTSGNSYSVTVTDPNGISLTLTMTLACETYIFHQTCFQVLGCHSAGTSSNPTNGISVTITPASGLTLSSTTLTTDVTGTVCWPYTTDSYGWAISHYRIASQSGTTSSCGTTTLTAATGYTCACNCNMPICNTLDLTDSILGSTTLVNTGSQWVGTLVISYPGLCGCPASTVTISYLWECELIVGINVKPGPSNICCGGPVPTCPDDTGLAQASLINAFTLSGPTCGYTDQTYTGTACPGCFNCGGTVGGCGTTECDGAQSTIWGASGAAVVITVTDSCT